MSPLRYEPGEVAKAKRRRVEILSVEGLERILCRYVNDGKTRYFSAQELDSLDSKKTEKEATQDSGLLDEKERARITRRIEVLRPILPCQGKERAQAVSRQAKLCALSRSTIYAWLKAYERGDKKASSLATRKRQNRKSRLNRPVLKILDEVITAHFETPQKPTMARTIEEVRCQFRAKGKKPPSATTIRTHIKLRDQRQQTLKRHGAAQARAQHDLIDGTSHHPASAPLDVVQMDHSLMDVMLVDSSRRYSIGRPWLTLAIDVHSRMVVGFYVSFENPSQFLVGLCLANCMLSKDLWLESMGLSAKNWPVWGRIRHLLVDNAKEFRSEGLENLCLEYETDLTFRGVGRPEHGGIVERFFKTLEGHVHELPGSTFSNPVERGEYESEKRAALTLDEFERFLADWIVSRYHITPHEGLDGCKPIDVWNEGIDGTKEKVGRGIPTKLDSEREAILVHAMPTDLRSVTRKGITWDYVHYTHPGLNRFLGKKIRVKRDPRNIKFIWFQDETTKQWFRAGYRTLSFPAVTLWELRATQKALREKGAKVDERAIFDGIARRRQLLEQASAQRQKANRRHKKALRTEEMKQKFSRDSNAQKPPKIQKLAVIEGGRKDDPDNTEQEEEEDFTKTPIRILKISKD